VGGLDSRGMPLEEFWQRLRALSREAFLAEYPHPFLLELTTGAPHPAADFHTVHDVARSRIEALDDPEHGVSAESRVFGVRKFTSQFAAKITVGRSKNNDVVVDDPRVSKLHAYVTVADGSHTLIDAESSNGTFHNGVRLPPLGRAVLANRHQVGFGGNARFVFVEPAHFQRQARFLLQRGEA
jgi:hypothetical protein